jgi:hypothetical protein
VAKKEHLSVEATIHRLQSLAVRARTFCAEALRPDWRTVLIGVATWLLYEAVRMSGRHDGKVFPRQGELCVIYSLLCFAALWAASRPTMPRWLKHGVSCIPAPLKAPLWRNLFLLILFLWTWNTLSKQIANGIHGIYGADAIAFVHVDADLLRQGRNPYTADDAFWAAEARWPTSLATPLLGSKAFGDNPRAYPTPSKMSAVLQFEIAHPQARDDHNFDPQTVHNYPAGIIWLAVPYIWAGVPSVMWLNVTFFVLLLAVVIMRAPATMRIPLVVALLANPSVMLYDMLVNFDVVCLFFVVAAWNWQRHERSSALLMGIACAVKQLAWFVAPFYLVEILRRDGWRAALRRSGWMAMAFIVPNLPFILRSPSAWLHSMVIPMTDPEFPLGFGPINLGLSGVVPLGTPHGWMYLVVGLMVALLAFQWLRPSVTSDGLFLSLLPLWMSWRSPMNYLALVPVLACWVAVSHHTKTAATPQKEAPAPGHPIRVAVDLPSGKNNHISEAHNPKPASIAGS